MTSTPPTVNVDFQNADRQGRVRLNTEGAMADIKRSGIALRDGDVLHLVDAELNTTGIAEFSTDDNMWVARVDWGDISTSGDG